MDAPLAALADEIARIAAERAAESIHEQPPQGAAGPTFFISHSKADVDFAEALKLRLERAGLTVWFDTERLSAGIAWRPTIDAALKSAAAVIVVVSPEARASEYVTYEWAFAAGAGIPVVPLLLRSTAFHPRLADLQYLDFRQGRPWSLLLRHLRALVAGTSGPD